MLTFAVCISLFGNTGPTLWKPRIFRTRRHYFVGNFPLLVWPAGSFPSLFDSSLVAVFKEGIRPMWEDEENIYGGKYSVVVPKNISNHVS